MSRCACRRVVVLIALDRARAQCAMGGDDRGIGGCVVLDGFDVDEGVEGPYVDLSAALPRSRGGWREADLQLRSLAARRRALDVAEAHWLRVAREAQVHKHLGFGSFVEYIERTLGYRPRTALERLRVADALAA